MSRDLSLAKSYGRDSLQQAPGPTAALPGYGSANRQPAVNTQAAVKAVIAAMETMGEGERVPPARTLNTPLLKHQRLALNWMCQRELSEPSGGILADDQVRAAVRLAAMCMMHLSLNVACCHVYGHIVTPTLHHACVSSQCCSAQHLHIRYPTYAHKTLRDLDLCLQGLGKTVSTIALILTHPPAVVQQERERLRREKKNKKKQEGGQVRATCLKRGEGLYGWEWGVGLYKESATHFV